MKLKALIGGVVCIGVVLGTFLLLRSFRPCANFHTAILQTPTQSLNIALAQTPAEKSKGLGKCKEVPEHSGMYFVFNDVQEQTFWMKDMLIPIDIIWIKEGKVIGIEQHVPNMPLDTADTDLPLYTSPGAVDGVLEVGSGRAKQYGIEEGVLLQLGDRH